MLFAALVAAALIGGWDVAGVDGCPAKSIHISPGTSIQQVVEKSPPSTSFCIKRGIHRVQQIAPKDGQVFVGEPGAILNGARLVHEVSRENGLWMVRERADFRYGGECLASRPTCAQPFRFFLDDRPLEPALRREDVKSGSFYLDRNSGTAYLADDPRGRKLEATAKAYAFWSNGARNVVVRGLIVEKYATPAQHGAIYGDEDKRASGWIIESNEVRLNSGGGIATGDRTIVRGNKVYRNGQLGISPNGSDVLVEGNEIYENNIYGFDAAWEGGGLKGGRVEGLILRRNNVHDNYGPGLWCDVECRRFLVEDNVVDRNADEGIFYEISYDAIIRNNVARFNGTGQGGQRGTRWFWGAGIAVAASEGVEVYGNTVVVADGGSGIMLIDQGRELGEGRRGHHRTRNNTVRDNHITYTGRSGTSGGASDVQPSHPNYGIIENGHNRFDGNTYALQRSGAEARFVWGGEPFSFAQFQRASQEQRGRVIGGQ